MKIPDEIPTAERRQLYREDQPWGYMESDMDYLENNRSLCVWFLDKMCNQLKEKSHEENINSCGHAK